MEKNKTPFSFAPKTGPYNRYRIVRKESIVSYDPTTAITVYIITKRMVAFGELTIGIEEPVCVVHNESIAIATLKALEDFEKEVNKQ